MRKLSLRHTIYFAKGHTRQAAFGEARMASAYHNTRPSKEQCILSAHREITSTPAPWPPGEGAVGRMGEGTEEGLLHPEKWAGEESSPGAARLATLTRGKLIRGFLIICNFILHSPVIQINLGGSPRLGRIVRKAPAKTSLESAKQNQFVYDLSLLEAGELELFPMLVKQLSSSSYAKPLFKLSLT